MEDVQHVIEAAVHAALGPMSINGVDVVFGHDQDDEEAYYVAIEVPHSTPRLGGERLLSAMTGVNDALIAAGERRFAYVKFRYLGEEAADEGESARSSES
ncbi:hypothetical protein [Lichenibacterium dinghuense]|uniref:hypothetical protein n=1 Tax=Lichenibacterium dinghuense TaxID=2895977 RepID=UPI001F463964|nr:hypothetical protein [Lichenibacterium sp. 6Y81]